jgi:hypothetical protein
MPSVKHQALLLWAARRMCAEGFIVAGFDQNAIQGGFWDDLPSPFMLKGYRPDAWAARQDGTLLAFAEAKTAADIDNGHTVAQLRTFGNVKMKGGGLLCPLYIAVPRCEVRKLDEVLIKTGLIGARHVLRLHVPEILLGGISRA